jgi:hypothetical protein
MFSKRLSMLALLTMMIALATLPRAAFAGSGPDKPSEVNNIVPEGLITPDLYEKEQQRSHERKMREAEARKARGEVVAQATVLAVPGVSQHPCGAYCAQASTQAVLYYKGQRSYTLDQIRSWENPGNVGCSNPNGTCLLPIRDTLNARVPGLPWAGFYEAVRLNHDSLNAAARDLEAKTKNTVGTYRMPLIALVNPNPPDGTPYCLPGWCGGTTSAGHYLTINGYNGTYNGTDASAAIYYRDSWYAPADQHWANTNNFADAIYYKDGNGSCTTARYNLIW